MNMKKMDLNNLLMFEAILETRSVSKAADRLGISQPSMSHALAKMRQAFDDPVFIRVKNEMQPTPHAKEIEAPIRQALKLARTEIFQSQHFEPTISTKTFTFCMTDIGATAYLPHIIKQIGKLAPSVKIRTVSPIAEKQEEGLESGHVDLAIGYFPDLKKAGVFQQKLLRNSGFVCIANENNPYAKNGVFSLKSFMAAPQVAVRTEGRSMEVIEKAMMKLKISRRVLVTVPHYLSLLSLIPSTDLVAIIPNDLADAFRTQINVKIYPLPFSSPTVEIKQIWHARFHRDSANRWIREIVRGALLQNSSSH